MRSKNLSILIVIVVLLGAAGVYAYYRGNPKSTSTKQNEPVATIPESDIPTQKNGIAQSDQIRVDYPLINQTISSPLEIRGQARGTWFFEASFPIYLYDSSGKKIATAIAQARGDWMTDQFVPFKAILKFSGITLGSKGTLVFEKDNPSASVENADELRMPVYLR